MKNRISIVLSLLAALTAAQEAKDAPVMRVYDLGPLNAGMKSPFYGEAPGPAEREFSLLGSSQQQEAGREGDTVNEEEQSEADLVIEIVRSFVGDVEGIFELEPIDGGRRLMARMKESDQKIVARVLEQIRAAGDPPVELDVRHLSIPDRSLDDAARAMLLASGGLEAEQIAALARFDLHGGRQGGTLHVALGRWGVYRAVRELRYVPDFDVEIAQAAAIADPRPAIATDGLKAAVRPFLLRDGRLLLRIVASGGDREGELRRFSMGATEVQDTLRLRNTDYQEIEQCDYRGGAVSTDAVVAPGKTVVIVLATEAGTGVRWDILALTVKAAPRPIVADTFVVAPVGALVAADPTRSLAWQGATGELALIPKEEEPSPRMAMDGVIEKMGFPAEQEGEFRHGDAYLFGGCLLLRGTAASLRKADDGIAVLERELIQPARLEIRLSAERARGESRTVGLLAAPMTVGRRVALAAYLRMDTVGDYDVEIAQEARIADPNHTVVTAGTFANADLFRNPDGTYRLHLDLTVTGAPEGIRTSASHAGGVPLVQTVPLLKRVAPIRFDLAAGRPRTVDLGPDPFSAAEEGRLVATVTVAPQ